MRPVDFARQAGVSKQAISAKIKNGTLVADAAGFLDTDNPINSAYISDPRRKSSKQTIISFPAGMTPAPAYMARGENPDARASKHEPVPLTEADLAAAAAIPATELLNYTLRDVVMKFSGMYNLEKHARTLRDITMAAEKEQRMAERSLRTIPRDFVASRVFPYLNMLMKQIIEYPEAAADNIVSKVLSDGPESRDAVIIMIRDGLSRIIAKSKEQVIKEMDSLRGRHSLGGEAADDLPDYEASEEV